MLLEAWKISVLELSLPLQPRKICVLYVFLFCAITYTILMLARCHHKDKRGYVSFNNIFISQLFR